MTDTARASDTTFDTTLENEREFFNMEVNTKCLFTFWLWCHAPHSAQKPTWDPSGSSAFWELARKSQTHARQCFASGWRHVKKRSEFSTSKLKWGTRRQRTLSTSKVHNCPPFWAAFSTGPRPRGPGWFQTSSQPWRSPSCLMLIFCPSWLTSTSSASCATNTSGSDQIRAMSCFSSERHAALSLDTRAALTSHKPQPLEIFISQEPL